MLIPEWTAAPSDSASGGAAPPFTQSTPRTRRWDRASVASPRSGALEVGVFEGGGRQRTQRWPIEHLEPAGAAALDFLERSVIERAEQLTNGGIQLGEAMEAPVSQPGENPALLRRYIIWRARGSRISGAARLHEQII